MRATRVIVLGGVVVCLVVLLVVAAVVARTRSTDAGPPAGTCEDPVFSTSADTGWQDGAYDVIQDMWGNTVGTQTLRACSHASWSITATQPDTPSVKTYPHVHRVYADVPVGSLATVDSRYASTGPGTGTYEFAYDIWLDGFNTPASTEVMIWTDTHGNVLHVPRAGAFTSGGRTYTVWRAGRFIAFVGPNSDSGRLDLSAFLRYAERRGWLSATSVLSRVDYGVEVCSTGGVPARFDVRDFSVAAR